MDQDRYITDTKLHALYDINFFMNKLADLISRVKNSIVYIGTRDDQGTLQNERTGFFIGIRSQVLRSSSGPFYYPYLVTAKHCLPDQSNESLHIKVNILGSSEFFQLDNWKWIKGDNEPDSDVAIYDFLDCFERTHEGLEKAQKLGSKYVTNEDFATLEKWQKNLIGLGSEIFTVGFFNPLKGALKPSQDRCIPRFGKIVKMPDEPLEHEKLGYQYYAYLIELTSLNGLSGAPVFVKIPALFLGPTSLVSHESESYNPFDEKFIDDHYLLIGLIKGHNKAEIQEANNQKMIHSGISMVTPVERITEILESEQVRHQREINEQKYYESSKDRMLKNKTISL